MIQRTSADIPSGEEDRFREYAERQRRVHEEAEARKAAETHSGMEALPIEEAERRRTQRRLEMRRRRIFAGLVAVAILSLIAVATWMQRPVIHAVTQDPRQVEWAEEVGLPLQITNSVGMTLRLIPPGSFQMGSPREEWGHNKDEPLRPVTIKRPFYIAATETTQEMYEQVMGENPSFFHGGSRTPVEYMKWDSALRFCNALSRREGLPEVYEKTESGWLIDIAKEGYRLPVEVEWEYACRAGTQDAAYTGPLGPDKAGQENLWRAAWFLGNAEGRPHIVAKREPNPWGLYDMLGNVWEWCWDWYRPYPVAQGADIFGPSEGEGRVVRGGGWYSEPRRCRAATRRRWYPDTPWNSAGFRCLRTINLAEID